MTDATTTPVIAPGAAPDPATDDAAIVAMLRDPDAAVRSVGGERLVKQFGPRMFAVARRYFDQDEDAWDAVQDALLSAVKSIDRFDSRSRLNTWLHRIVVNACLMRLRTRRRRPETSIEEMLPTFIADGHAAKPAEPWRRAGESGIEASEAATLVRRALEQLPDGYREVLLLRDVEGLDTAEAAAALGITENAVKTRLHRARLALRGLLDPHFREGPSAPSLKIDHTTPSLRP